MSADRPLELMPNRSTADMRRCALCTRWEPLPGLDRSREISVGVCPIKRRLSSAYAVCEAFESKVVQLRPESASTNDVPGLTNSATRENGNG